MTIGEFKRKAAPLLHSSQTPLLDLDLLIMAALDISREKLLIEQNTFEIPNNIVTTLEGFVAERKKGTPICYITGHKEFFGLDFIVTRDTLPPKPDTETLVEVAIDYIRAQKKETVRVLDICCGTGCVGLSILHSLTHSPHPVNIDLTLSDISDAALTVAKENACHLASQASIHFIKSNLFENIKNIKGTFDIVATNPPYIPHNEVLELLADGRGEPLLALDGGESGLEIFFELISQAVLHTNTIVAELSPDVMTSAENFAREKGYFVKVFNDLSGSARVIALKK